MKKLLFVAAVAAFTMTSCKKDYTCACTAASGNIDYDFEKVKKKDAKDACETLNTLWTTSSGSCELK